MSIQSEINRINNEVGNQEDLVSQILLALSNKTIVKEGQCQLYIENIDPSPILAEGTIIITES